MSKYYWHCDECNGNYDHGEKCDCDERPRLIVDDSLVLGVDISGGKDITCITMAKRRGTTVQIVNTVYGEEAEKTYNILMNRGGVIHDKNY